MNSDSKTQSRLLLPSEKQLIHEIADLYFNEWGSPVERTIVRLSRPMPNEDDLFQLILSNNSDWITTGGVSLNVNILNIYPELKKFGPWISMLCTKPEYRSKGYGEQLLNKIEKSSKEFVNDKLYLYTFTAEDLYRRNGWETIERVMYKGYETAVMEKRI
ncbi:MAG: GNAT family N-acetyltransferase [Bacteroidetes bacterium]|nr:GNAT family N-acetyltransferase [Bacteroidota bacterium]